jgi:4-hydroxybenzoyl-CoA reductase subunit alpha
MPAVANAIFDAAGVRVDELPITPEKVAKALDEKRKGGAGRVGPRAFPEIAWPPALLVPPPWEGGDGKATNDADVRDKKKERVRS